MVIPTLNMPETDYMRVINYTTKSNPKVHYRTLEQIKTGTWFFGLFNTYRYEWSEWKTDSALKENNT